VPKDEPSKPLKIGEVARRSGLTVRALRHYENLGLLRVGRGATSRHRTYGLADVERVQKIVAMRQLGFSLAEIAQVFRRATPLVEVVAMRLRAAREQQASAQRVCRTLESFLSRLRQGIEPSIDELLHLTGVMTMNEKYFTAEQSSQLKSRAAKLGPDAVKENERQWKKLITEVKALHQGGASAGSAQMQALAAKSEELIQFITGGDSGIRSALSSFYRGEPDSISQALGGVDRAVFQFLGEARRIQQRR
jgi:DNA-binding transcriptional MerR regulator